MTTTTKAMTFVSDAISMISAAASSHGAPARIAMGSADRGVLHVRFADGSRNSYYPTASMHPVIIALRDAGNDAAADELCRASAIPAGSEIRAAFSAAFPTAKLSIR